MTRFVAILRYWLPVLIWMGVIAFESFALSSVRTGVMLTWFLGLLHIHLSPEAFDKFHHVLRKIGHFVGYGVLCFLLFRAWLYSLRQAESSRRNAAILALAGTLVIASLDEWHQSFDNLRTATPWDVALDLFGGAIFLAVALAVYHRTRRAPHSAAA